MHAHDSECVVCTGMTGCAVSGVALDSADGGGVHTVRVCVSVRACGVHFRALNAHIYDGDTRCTCTPLESACILLSYTALSRVRTLDSTCAARSSRACVCAAVVRQTRVDDTAHTSRHVHTRHHHSYTTPYTCVHCMSVVIAVSTCVTHSTSRTQDWLNYF
jgi:hypothetical protein